MQSNYSFNEVETYLDIPSTERGKSKNSVKSQQKNEHGDFQV